MTGMENGKRVCDSRYVWSPVTFRLVPTRSSCSYNPWHDTAPGCEQGVFSGHVRMLPSEQPEALVTSQSTAAVRVQHCCMCYSTAAWYSTAARGQCRW